MAVENSYGGTLRIETSDATTLASASAVYIDCHKPDKTIVTFTAVVNGSKIDYTITDGDIDQDGFWLFQGRAVGNGFVYRTPLIIRQVHEGLVVNS
jgi:hypothetical protein